MRRLFIIRKDLHLSAGKMSAMVGHCCEAYWTNLLKREMGNASNDGLVEMFDEGIRFPIFVDPKIWDEYVNGIFTKTICEAKNLNQLMKIKDMIEEYNNENLAKACVDPNVERIDELVEGVDYGFINDKCLTELKPENEDGTTIVGMWFRPLPDDLAHRFSKKYKLYRD